MFEIFPVAISKIENQEIQNAIKQLAKPAHGQGPFPDQESMPFVQLGYDEVSQEEIDRLFGFASISENNQPIGIDGEFEEISAGNDYVVYSLRRFQGYLESIVPDIVQRYFRCGSMDAYCDDVGDDMTAIQYAVGGVLECIKFCVEYRCALAIRW